MKNVKEWKNKKLDGLTVEKNIHDGLQNNPNNLTSNLTGKTSSDTKIEILKYGSKHGLATRPSEVEMIVKLLEISGIKLNKKDCVTILWNKKELKLHWEPLRTLIDIYDKQYSHDKKKINVIKQLREKCMILKPDKGNGVMLINKVDYHDPMNQLFSDKWNLKS